MNESLTDKHGPTILERIHKSLGPSGLPTDDRGRMRMVVDNLVLVTGIGLASAGSCIRWVCSHFDSGGHRADWT